MRISIVTMSTELECETNVSWQVRAARGRTAEMTTVRDGRSRMNGEKEEGTEGVVSKIKGSTQEKSS